MKINTSIYGVPSHLYHSYSPLESSRSSSLTNNYAHTPNYTNQRTNHPNPNSLLIRQLPREMPTNPQKEIKKNVLVAEYYSQMAPSESEMKWVRRRLQEMEKKITKTGEEIILLKERDEHNGGVKEQIKWQQEMLRLTESDKVIERQLNEKVMTIQREMRSIRIMIGGREESTSMSMIGDHKKGKTLGSSVDDRKAVQMDEKYLIKIKSLMEERIKQETIKIKLIIENQNNKLSNYLKKQMSKDNSSQNPIKSNLKFPFQSIKLHYKEFVEWSMGSEKGRLSTRQSSDSPRDSKYSKYSSEYGKSMGNMSVSDKLLKVEQKTYFIDKQGYLLDQNNYYLLGEDNNMIRLNKDMMLLLKKEGLLKSE